METNKRINDAVQYLKNLKIEKKDIGKEVYVNDRFYYRIQQYSTKSSKECRFESHKQFIDIHMIIEGVERIDMVDVLRLKEQENYSSENDTAFWNEVDTVSTAVLSKGGYMVITPQIAHMTGQIVNEPSNVIKIVGKVMVGRK